MEPKRLERKLAAILYADVAGYSRLTGEDEEGTHQRLSTYLDLISASVEQHHGKVSHFAGDAVLADFTTVSDALVCAAAVQRDLDTRNADLPEERKVRFRIGVNMGEVIVDRNEIYGDGVNVAARLQSLAEPGGICISESVHTAIGNKLPLDYDFIGEQRVKNIENPVRAYHARLKTGVELPTPAPPVAVASIKTKPTARRTFLISGLVVVIVVAGVLAWLRPWVSHHEPASVERTAFPLPDKPSIAVLPFQNLSGDPQQNYFADGMTEDLITDLSKVAGLFVIARNSTFAYRDKSRDIRRVAEELGVRYVLEGSVRRSGDQVRINAQLIDATTGGHIWADRYDGGLNDVFALQDKVTGSIVAVLAVQLTTGDHERAARKGTRNAQAYDTFLKGWQHYLRQTPDDFRKAITHFERAVELDPEYSRAYAALAATYWETWNRYWHESVGLNGGWHEPRFRAEQFLAKAMQNPTPLAHQVASGMYAQMGEHDKAITEAEHAIALDPNDAESYIALAGALSLAGQPDRALELVERAMRLNPHYPPFYLYQLGLAQFGTEQLKQAADSLEKAARLNPDDRWSLRLLLATYGLLNRDADATRILKAIQESGKRGVQASTQDPLTIRSTAFWHPFKNHADAKRLADGLRMAGVPD
jgi:adenylate cyclase